MPFRRTSSLGRAANHAATDFASRVDGETGEVARRAAVVVTAAARLLRIPTAVVGAAPVPFIVATIVLGLLAEGGVGVVILVVGGLMALVSVAFWARRRKILQAVDDPEKLATELAIMISLSDKVEETRGALAQITGGEGARVFSRMRGVWSGVSMPGRWIEQVGDLPRARYFAPPKIGTTVSVSIAALWLVPVSIVVAVLSAIASLASAV